MNNKIFIALALASIFISAQATYVAITCKKTDGTTDLNCASCPNNSPGTCVTCPTSFFLDSTIGGCTACIAGCKTCTGTTAALCTVPLDGFYLATGPVAVTGCIANCKTCTGTSAALCTAPMTSFFIDSPAALTGCIAGCATCTGITAALCTVPLPAFYLATGPAAVTGCVTNCNVCTGTTAATCTTPATAFYLATGPAAVAGCITNCGVCTGITAALCTTPNAGYFKDATPAITACGDALANNNCAACSAVDVCTSCKKGTLDTIGVCCAVQNCATCGVPATVVNANNVCATPAIGYGLLNSGANTITCSTISAGCSRCDALAGALTVIGTCSACKTGYTNTATSGAAVCVASTPVPSTDSPSSAAFNVTPTAVFINTETSTPAFTGVVGGATYGPGFDDSTAYVWVVVVPTTGTVSVNRRTINATFGSSLAKVNGTADVAITTAIPFGANVQAAVGPGYLGIASLVQGMFWNNVGGTATASDVSLTYIAVNGSSATTKSVAGNTNVNVFFSVQSIWYDTGVFYVIYTMFTRTPGTAPAGGTATADTYAANGIYINGISVSTGATIYNGTTGGIKSIALTASNTGTTTGLLCGSGCASMPNVVPNFIVGGNNRTNSSMVNYVWQDASATASVIKTGMITIATGAGTAGTVLATNVAAVGTGTVAIPVVTTTYTVGGVLGSFGTSGVFVNKKVSSDNGAGATTTNPTVTYSTMAYINGSSTASGNVTIVSGYMAPTIQGYGTADGYVLVEQHYAITNPTNSQRTLVQVEKFFTNGSINGAAASLGTYQDTPVTYQDTNGSIYLGYTVVDTLTSKTYAGYLGKYLALSLAAGASTLTSIFAFLSLMIVALFAF